MPQATGYERKWLRSTYAFELLRFLNWVHPTPRKYRSLSLAVCRLLWDVLPPEGRRAVEVSERACDGDATDSERIQAAAAAFEAANKMKAEQLRNDDTGLVLSTISEQTTWLAWHVSSWGRYSGSNAAHEAITFVANHDAAAPLTPLIRDVFGNPFRPVAFDPDWRTDTVMSLARGMYESRDFAAMPILADALQDAGCEHADILSHCRGDGPHVRGCWVVDLVLGLS